MARTKKIEAHSIKCDACGDNMVFSPDKNALYCSSCHSTKEILSNRDIQKHDVLTLGEISNEKGEAWAKEEKGMKCPNCGSNVILHNYQMSATCPYCDTSLVAKKEALYGLKPDGVIPFSFGKEKAYELFKQKSGRRNNDGKKHIYRGRTHHKHPRHRR